MKAKISQIVSIPLIQDSLKLSSSNFIMFFLPLVVTPILSRIYDPSLFGEWGVFSGVFVIIQVVLFASYEYVIIKSNADEVANICALCLIVAICIISVVAMMFAVGTLSHMSFFTNFPYKNQLFLYLLITVCLGVFQNVANRQERYRLMAVSNILMGGTQAVFRVVFGLLVVFSNGLITGTICAQLFNVLFFIYFLHGTFNKEFVRSISLRKIHSCAKKYYQFPLYDAPGLLLSFAAFNLPVIILSFYFSKEDIGCYSIIIQLLLLPISFIGAAIGKVYYQQISQYAAGNMDRITQITTVIVKTVGYLSVIPTLFITLGGDKLIALFLGHKWTTSANMAICLTLWSIPTILTQPLLSIYRYFNKQSNMLIYNTLYFTLGVGILILGCIFELKLYPILILYALVCSITKILLFNDMLRLTNIRFSSLPLLTKLLWGCCILLLAVRLHNI